MSQLMHFGCLGLCLGAVGCDAVDVSAPSAAPITIPIVVGAGGFMPREVAVLRGDTLAFRFGDLPHTVVWNRFQLGVSPLDITNPSTNVTVHRVVPGAGTFPYHCGIHLDELGVVTVVNVREDS